MKIYLLQENCVEKIPFYEGDDEEGYVECHDVIFVSESLEKVIEKRDEHIAESNETADMLINQRNKYDYLILVADTESGEVEEYKEI